jgi:hypothetical protein
MLKNLSLKNNKTSTTKLQTKKNDISVSKSIDRIIKHGEVNRNNNNVLNMLKANFQKSISSKNSVNLYKPVKQNTRSTNESSLYRLNTFTNKNFSKENLYTETTYLNTIETTDRNFILPNKIKQKVSNIRLYSKPKLKGSLISDQFKNLSINKLRTSENISSQIRPKKNNPTVKSMYDVKKVINLKLNLKVEPVCKPVKNLSLLKKKTTNTKHNDYKKICEYENRQVTKEREECYEIFNTEESEGALSVNEVKDLVKTFDFRDIKENTLFGEKNEKIYNTNRRDKYYEYFFRGIIDK